MVTGGHKEGKNEGKPETVRMPGKIITNVDDWLVKRCKLQNVKDFPTVGKYFDKRKVHISADGGGH